MQNQCSHFRTTNCSCSTTGMLKQIEWSEQETATIPTAVFCSNYWNEWIILIEHCSFSKFRRGIQWSSSIQNILHYRIWTANRWTLHHDFCIIGSDRKIHKLCLCLVTFLIHVWNMLLIDLINVPIPWYQFKILTYF